MNRLDDIIAAIATPIGEGGISVLRVSGKGAIELSGKRFRGRAELRNATSHTAHFGVFLDGRGESIDEVVATVFRGPKSYTGEDAVEISCHGGMFVTRMLLESLLECGARAADPGEFTKRAFLNGRIDLPQAEAIADLIKARSEDSRRVSMIQLQGKLSGKVKELREKLLNLCSLIELDLDFSEEGLEVIDKSRINNDLSDVIGEIQGLIDSYQYGKLYREGVKVVLIGRPNVGKSSILNALLAEQRAIVTEIPGTTRDMIQESINLGGLLISLTDTAGLRESDDPIEREGMRRTHGQIEESDIVVLVVEAGSFNEKDFEILQGIVGENGATRSTIVAVNKIDLHRSWTLELHDKLKSVPIAYVSAKTLEGLRSFEELLHGSAFTGTSPTTEKSIIVTNARQKDSFDKAKAHLDTARQDLREGRSNEFLAINLRLALDRLGEIIGTVATDDILNRIFAGFCIGK